MAQRAGRIDPEGEQVYGWVDLHTERTHSPRHIWVPKPGMFPHGGYSSEISQYMGREVRKVKLTSRQIEKLAVLQLLGVHESMGGVGTSAYRLWRIDA